MTEKKIGKVWLVGAGPGDAELLTVKAQRLIREADVIVYDRLVGQSILLGLPAGAELIDVGKRSGNHTMPQEEINRVLVRKAQEGKKVVRLKGGDPFVFGRGGEELELLQENGVPFEEVPGITSAIAVPAYNGIPVTHRDCTSSLHIITGHRKKGEKLSLDFRALKDVDGTLIFLMGVAALEEICQGLLEAGMDPEMPAAYLQQGTTAGQKKLVSTVSGLPEAIKHFPVDTPGIIVVGRVCAYHERFSWFDRLPLFGEKIVITRPAENGSRLSDMLHELGAQVLEIPSIKTETVEDNEPLREAIRDLSSFDWLVLTSPVGVRVFLDAMRAEKKDIRALGTGKIAVVGKGTAAALEERNIIADLIPETFDSEGLGQRLVQELKPGDRVLIPRAEAGDPKLAKVLLQSGKAAEVRDIPTYRTVPVSQDLVSVKDEFESGRATMAVFTSASTVEGFVRAAEGLDLKTVRAVCIGEKTRAAADSYNMITYVSEKASLPSLTEAVKRVAGEKQK